MGQRAGKVTPLYLVRAPRPQATSIVELASEVLQSLPDDERRGRIGKMIDDSLTTPLPSKGPPPLKPPTLKPAIEPTRVTPKAIPWSKRRAWIVAAAAFVVVFNVALGVWLALDARAPEVAGRPRAVGAAPVIATCEISAPARVLARSVLVRGGVEAVARDGRLAIGAVRAAGEGVAFELDAATLSVKSATKVIAGAQLARVLPAIDLDAPLDAVAEMAPAHLIASGDGEAFEIGSRGGYVILKAHDPSDAREWRLWPTATDVEAPRIARGLGDRVVALRRESAIWMGAVRVDRDGARAIGALVRVSSMAAQVGAPSIDARGDDVIAAWAQRDTKDDPWSLRWTRWKRGARVGPVHVLAATNRDAAIAPSVAALGGGAFALAWTQTDAEARHRVRAQTFGSDDGPAAPAFDVSPAGADAGQAQVAIGDGGRGAIGYLVGRGRTYDLAATALACR